MNSFKELRIADIQHNNASITQFDEYQLTGAQLFIKNLFNPNTLYKSLLINWQTGVGKSIAAISIANEFIKQYQYRYSIGEKKSRMVCILGFNTTETIQADLIKYPELGYVTKEEVDELNKLLISDDPKYTSYLGTLHRRLGDKSSGGYYKFYGYKEFVNQLFIITERAVINKFSTKELFRYDNNIEDLVKKNYIIINQDLISSLKNGVIIADEIHNVYNSLDSNNYGDAIKYVLHLLGNDAPRLVLMSATPITGNAGEVIDLINLLNPGYNLNRSDYFYKDENDILQPKQHTIQDIIKLTTGKVSYLLDTDTNLYPRRIFVGNNIEHIPYIKINVSSEPELHKNAILEEDKEKTYVINDMVFPNPLSETIGLHSDIIEILQSSDTAWRKEHNIEIYKDNGVNIITGNFLHKNNLKRYSTKYYDVLTDILDNLITSGKVMVYHHRVQLSGVLLLQEMFKHNGFIDDISEPNNSTLCVLCGLTLNNHQTDHSFKPCRFIIAHSLMNKSVMKKNILKYNDSSNLYGTEYKLIIGSRIIKEGINFKAIRYQYILSLPVNFPVLIQVLGRVVRKSSHIELPKKEQTVYIKIYANSTEIPKYIIRAKEYVIIQEIERALRTNAVDNFINYHKIVTNQDTLESLKFNPINIEKPPITSKYFNAYGHNTDEILLIKKLILLLFSKQNIWTYADLWTGIKSIENVNYNLDLINQGNFDIALHSLKICNVNNQYYIKCNYNDLESYYRNRSVNTILTVNLNNLYANNKPFKLPKIDGPIEFALIELPYESHIELLKRIVTKVEDDKKFIDLYIRFKILIVREGKYVGFVDKLSVNIYNNGEFIHEPLSKYNIGYKYEENDLIVGYVENTKFKIRVPIIKQKYKDTRLIKTGSVCEYYTRNDLIELLNKLRKINEYNVNYAFNYDNKITSNFKKQSINQLCNIIKLYMLYFEERSRSSVNGVRWVYLFHDKLNLNKE